TEWTYSLYKYNDTENSYKETQEFIISSVTDSNSGTYTCRGKSSDSQFSEDNDSAAASSNTVYPQVMARKKKQNESDAEPSDVTYAEIDMKHIKKPKRKQGKSSEGADTVYSELKQNTDNGKMRSEKHSTQR
ncbi:hypothetical protein Q7C36_004350, partial [Tachysurus vachellii]